VRRRWDVDERGTGVADASLFLEGARELLSAMYEPQWVAEQPEVHLVPHLEHACAEVGSELAFEEWRVDDDGVLVLQLQWRGQGDKGDVRRAAFALVGQVAESATYVRQRVLEDRLVFDVVTGMVGPDTHFAPHGHTLRLDVSVP
jgi:hypothetical protein